MMADFLARRDLVVFDDIDRFVCHPGGAKVVAALEGRLWPRAGGARRRARRAARLWQYVGRYRDVRARTHVRGPTALKEQGADECAGSGFYCRVSCARQSVTVLYWTLVLIALQRLAELAWAARNTAQLRRLGAVEADAGGYPLFVLLHAGWLAGLALAVPAATLPSWPLLARFRAMLQLGRLWVILESRPLGGRRGS